MKFLYVVLAAVCAFFIQSSSAQTTAVHYNILSRNKLNCFGGINYSRSNIFSYRNIKFVLDFNFSRSTIGGADSDEREQEGDRKSRALSRGALDGTVSVFVFVRCLFRIAVAFLVWVAPESVGLR